MLSGQTIKLASDELQTIREVKVEIEAQEGIPWQGQSLLLGVDELENDRTLGECGVQSKALLQLVRKLPLQICVKTPTDNFFKTINLDVYDDNTIEDIKATIHDREGILPREQIVLFAQQQLGDECTLRDCNIQNESVVHVVLRPLEPTWH
jgi:ubiquitin C